MSRLPEFPCEPIRNFDGNVLVEAGVLWGQRRPTIGMALSGASSLGPILKYRAIIFTRDDRTLTPKGLFGDEGVRDATRYPPSKIQNIEAEKRRSMQQEAFEPSIINFISTEGDKSQFSDRMVESDAFKLAFQLNKALLEIRAAVDGNFDEPDPKRSPLYPIRQPQLAEPTQEQRATKSKKNNRLALIVIGALTIVVLAIAVPLTLRENARQARIAERLAFAEQQFAYLDSHPSMIVPGGHCKDAMKDIASSMTATDLKTTCDTAWGIAVHASNGKSLAHPLDFWQVSTDFHAAAILYDEHSEVFTRADGKEFPISKVGVVLNP